MTKLLTVLLQMTIALDTPANDIRLLTAFDETSALSWFSVNDNVMGGRSNGIFSVADGRLLFTGALNTDGGGFASIRSEEEDLSMGSAQGIAVRVRGDGRTYKLRLMTRESQVSFNADFATTAGMWQALVIPFDQFVPTWRGRRLDRPGINPAEIVSIGFMIADKTDGDFRLEVDWIGMR